MIHPEISRSEKYKHIYYRNSNDVAIRHLVLDLKDNVIQDEVSEYAKDGRHLTSVVFAPDHVTVLGYREYQYDEAGQETGYRNYKRIDGELTLLYSTQSSWIEKDAKAICKFYDSNGLLMGYEIFEHDENCGMVWMGTFDKEGNNGKLPYMPYSDF